MERKKKTRGYLDSYLALGFIKAYDDHSLPYCLLCCRSYSNDSMRFGKLQDHFLSKHQGDSNMPVKYFQLLKRLHDIEMVEHGLNVDNRVDEHGLLLTSFKLSLIIAKLGKAHTYGEDIIKPAIKCYMETVLKLDPSPVDCLSLSNDTVRSRIDKMGQDVEHQLIEKIKYKKFSLQLDESTVRRGEALLMAYVRYIENGKFCEEMMFCASLKQGTTSKEIFDVLYTYMIKNNIPFTNIVSCAADGAPSMQGKNSGCLKLIKDQNPSMLTVHCVIHRESLVAKNLSISLNEILSLVIKCINTIKSSAKNERLFKLFCESLNVEHVILLLHTEVRWLSKGNCLKRFLELFEVIGEFLSDNYHMKKLLNEDGREQVAYLADIFQMLKTLNLQLQGKEMTLIDSKIKIFGFISRLGSLRNDVMKDDLSEFPNLRLTTISIYVKKVIISHLEMLELDFIKRFEDLKNMHFPMWLMHPFDINVSSIEDRDVKSEFYELQNDPYMRSLYQIKGSLAWVSDDLALKYPRSCKIARDLLCPFPSSYLVECGFSAVTDILTKKRNGLDVFERGDLRLKLTSIVPDVKKICENMQFQPSH